MLQEDGTAPFSSSQPQSVPSEGVATKNISNLCLKRSDLRERERERNLRQWGCALKALEALKTLKSRVGGCRLGRAARQVLAGTAAVRSSPAAAPRLPGGPSPANEDVSASAATAAAAAGACAHVPGIPDRCASARLYGVYADTSRYKSKARIPYNLTIYEQVFDPRTAICHCRGGLPKLLSSRICRLLQEWAAAA